MSGHIYRIPLTLKMVNVFFIVDLRSTQFAQDVKTPELSSSQRETII